MALKVGELWYELGLDDRPFRRGMDQAVKAGGSRLDKLSDAARDAGAGMGRELERAEGPMRAAGGRLADAAGTGLSGLSAAGRKAADGAVAEVAAREGGFAAAGRRLADAAGSGFDAMTGRARQAMSTVARDFDSLSEKAGQWGPKVVAAAGVAGAGLFLAAQKADQLAAATRRIEGNLGSASSATLDFVRDANRIGLSDRAAAGFVASIAEMQVGMGVASDQAAKMTTKTVELTAKLAALKGVSPEEGLAAIQSALIGEYDPLQKLVPTISAAAIEHRALADSGKQSADALTAAEKATATLNLVTEDASATIQRAGGEQVTLALQTAKAKAGLDDLVTAIGQGAQPMIGFLADKVGAAADQFDQLPDGVKSTAGAIAGIGTVAAGVVGGLGMLVGQAAKVRDAFTTVGADGVRSLNGLGTAAKGAGIALGALSAGVVFYEIAQAVERATTNMVGFNAEIARLKSGKSTPLEALKGQIDDIYGSTEKLRDVGNNFLGFATFGAFDLDTPTVKLGKYRESIEDIDRAIRKTAETDPAMAVKLIDEVLKSASDPDGYRGAARLKNLRSDLKELRGDLVDLSGDTEAGSKATEKAADSYQKAADSLAQYEANLKAWGMTAEAAKAGADWYKGAVEASTVTDDQIDNAMQLGQAFRSFATPESLAALPKSIDQATLAMGGYSNEQMTAIQGLLKLGDASTSYLSTMIEQGATAEQVSFAAAGLRDQYQGVFDQLGFTSEQTAEYLKVLGLTPEQVETAVKLSGDAEARFKIEAYQGLIKDTPKEKLTGFYAKIAESDYQGAAALLDGLARDRTATVHAKIDVDKGMGSWGLLRPVTTAWNKANGFASGGQVPGTGTGDTVPAWLTPGEYVIRKPVVDLLGRKVLDDLNAGQVVQAEQRAARYATGGPVGAVTSDPRLAPPRIRVPGLHAAVDAVKADLTAAVTGRTGNGSSLYDTAPATDVTGIEARLDATIAAVDRLSSLADRGDTFHVTSPDPARSVAQIARRRRSERWLTTGAV